MKVYKVMCKGGKNLEYTLPVHVRAKNEEEAKEKALNPIWGFKVVVSIEEVEDPWK